MNNRQRINLENILAAHAAQYQKNKQPNPKMGRRPKQTFHQGRHTDGQEAHKKMLNIINYQRHSYQNYNVVANQSEWLLSKNLEKINAGKGVVKMVPSCTVGGNVN